jgi:hypothetical protein
MVEKKSKKGEQQGRLRASSAQPAFGGGCKVLFAFHRPLSSPWMSILMG